MMERSIHLIFNVYMQRFVWYVYAATDTHGCSYECFDRDTVLELMPKYIQSVLDATEV